MTCYLLNLRTFEFENYFPVYIFLSTHENQNLRTAIFSPTFPDRRRTTTIMSFYNYPSDFYHIDMDYNSFYLYVLPGCLHSKPGV